MKKLLFFLSTIILILFGSGCNQKVVEESIYATAISQNMVHLSNAPNEVKSYFETKIKDKNGGLHTFEFEGKTYFLLLEPNRAISSFYEYRDHIRVVTRDSFEEPGSFDSVNDIVSVLYIPFIESLNKPFGVFRVEDLVE
ncbi:hypothetical protein ACJ2A9_23130 [Anaerobacillus sp. MEB173]|uniref:hypothetical protein n=1 Tax=Anaerobacillus sp. MEB173 TaxID=3383345 RepID=UPI003F8EAE73